MGFVISAIGSAASAIISAIFDIIVEIVEKVIEFIVMFLMDFDDVTETIEYYSVHNYPLFDNADQHNVLRNILFRSIFEEEDIAGQLIYASAFRSLKGNVQEFVQFIDNGNYIESFPSIESYITYPDYTEITDVLTALNGGSPCTIETAFTRGLDGSTWIRYWLQENKGYNYTSNLITVDSPTTVSTSPSVTSSSMVVSTGSPTFLLTLTDEVSVSDALSTSGMTWEVNYTGITYNPGTDDYTIDLFDALGNTETLPYTVPGRSGGLYYLVTYYLDSAPSEIVLFVYRVGDGTYPTLDNPQDQINIDATALQALPAIPLRIANVNYTERPEDEVQKINDLCLIIDLDAEAVLDAIIDDPSAPPEDDLDNVYINFGIRMWDTTQIGMAYLFNFCENLFPAQSVTLGIYNESPIGDDKPQNNVIITSEGYKAVFQFSYMTYQFTTLAAIDADSGSTENGIYYSDLTKFDANGDLKYSYFSSSGKGTYNVGYKADNLSEVQDFLDGIGVVNPGDTSGEATNWLQVTKDLSYNNPTPVLQESDGSVSTLVHLRGDMVYENNGSGVLRLVRMASEETLIGQSITYYKITPAGLEAYTVHAPIGAFKVIDGASGAFKLVKFNLGNTDDLMVPFIHNFIKGFSNTQVSQLFLASAHASMYVAHYETITRRVASGFNILALIIVIIIIIVVMIVTYGGATPMLNALFAPTVTAGTGVVAGGTAVAVGTPLVVSSTGVVTVASTGAVVTAGTISSAAAVTGIVSTATVSGITAAVSTGAAVSTAFAVAWVPTLIGWATQFAVSQIVQYAVGAIAKKSPALAAAVGIAGIFIGYRLGAAAGSSPGVMDYAKAFIQIIQTSSTIVDVYVENKLKGLASDYEEDLDVYNQALNKLQLEIDALKEVQESLFSNTDGQMLASIAKSTLRVSSTNITSAEVALAVYSEAYEIPYSAYEYDEIRDAVFRPPEQF